MAELPSRPLLRPVEIVPLTENGRRSFLLSDPAGHLEAPLQLSGAALLLLSLCDGSRAPEAIGADYRARSGQPLSAEELAEFLATMDEMHLLESPRFAAHRAQLEQQFIASRWRAAHHAGGAYEADAMKLATTLDGWLERGSAGGRRGDRLRALIAPHIDFHRGGEGYGLAYAALRGREAPEVVVLIGTGHAAEEGRFIVCDKGFETPLGRLAADDSFLARLEHRLPRSYRRGQLAHQNEHSLELQAVWLAHLYGEHVPTIVPILGTSFDDLMERGNGPLHDGETRDFLGALRETWQEERRRVVVVVGADFSHVGPRFGDERPADGALLAEVRARDEAALVAIGSGSAERFFEAVAAHRNVHRICSVAAIYAALFTVEAESGDRLVYHQAVAPDAQLAVTFAGVALYGAAEGASGASAGLAREPRRRA